MIDRSEAKAGKLTWYFAGKPCKHGHVCKRLTSDGSCHECGLAKLKRKRESDPDRARARVAAWRNENRLKIADYNRVKYHADADSARRRVADYKEKNRAEVLAALKRWQAENKDARQNYMMENRHKYRAYAMARNAQKLNATPKWADHQAISAIYEAARLRSEQTGEVFHVDHIVPLQSDLVCGLHVETNLQVLSASQNMSKGNHWWPDMWAQ